MCDLHGNAMYLEFMIQLHRSATLEKRQLACGKVLGDNDGNVALLTSHEAIDMGKVRASAWRPLGARPVENEALALARQLQSAALRAVLADFHAAIRANLFAVQLVSGRFV